MLILKITILIAVYLISCYAMYKFLQKAYYHPRGRWKTVKPSVSDLIFVFLPLANTIWAVDSWVFDTWEDDYYRKKGLTNFFRPKNPF